MNHKEKLFFTIPNINMTKYFTINEINDNFNKSSSGIFRSTQSQSMLDSYYTIENKTLLWDWYGRIEYWNHDSSEKLTFKNWKIKANWVGMIKELILKLTNVKSIFLSSIEPDSALAFLLFIIKELKYLPSITLELDPEPKILQKYDIIDAVNSLNEHEELVEVLVRNYSSILE